MSAWRAMEDHGDDEQQKKSRRDGLWKSRDGYGRLTKIEHSLFYEKGTLLMS